MSDQHIQELVDAHLHNLLEPAEAHRVSEHCEKCDACRHALEQAQTRLQAVSSLPPVEASEELIRKTVQNIDRSERARTRVRKMFAFTSLAVTAASILIIGGFNIYFANLKASPFDVHILGQRELMAGTPASLRVRVVDRNLRQSMAGVPVTLALLNRTTDQQVELARFTTDENGSGQPQFSLPDWPNGQYELRITARPAGETEILTQQISLKRSWKLMLTSDKPVYQPGQEIKLRAMALRRPDLKPVHGQEALFSIRDPKGNIIYRQKEVTSRFGITSTNCRLADEILEGVYKLTCQIGETESALAVEVKKYVLPKFKISIELDKPYYQPGQKVTGTVQADYFFGKPVADAKVLITVDADESDGENGLPITELKLTADKTGKAKFEFTLRDDFLGSEKNFGDAPIQLTVVVTDTAGQKQEARASRIVTANPLRIEVIAESGSLVRGVENRIYLFTSYADGRPAQTRVSISGQKQELETSDLGITSFELLPKTFEVGLTIRATDSEGLIGRRHVKLATGNIRSDFLVRTDKAVYTAGETVEIVCLGGGSGPVFLDFLKDGQTLSTESVAMQAGRGETSFDLAPELFGTVQLVAYRYQSQSGLAVMKKRTLYIQRPGELKIKASLDKAEYRPGQKAKLNLTLTDADGNPTPGAISLSAVDEAVYHILGKRPGLEQTFFTLEQEMLKPVYAIYGNWSPKQMPAGSAEFTQRAEFDQALFSRTSSDVPTSDEVALIGGGSSSFSQPLTLSAVSFPDKLERIDVRRAMGLDNVTTAWWSLAGCVVAVLLIAFAVTFPKVFAISGAAVGALGVLFLFLLVRETELGVNLTAGAKSDKAKWAASSLPVSVAQSPSATGDNNVFLPNWGPDDDEGGKRTGNFAFAQGVRGNWVIDFNGDEGIPTPARVRHWFPETLLWRPEVITDENGRASIDIDLADSITSWRISGSAVSSGGKLGAMNEALRVFQPFFVDLNLPVALTRNDEVSVPVVVYNYLDKPQTVELSLARADWFQWLDRTDDAAVVRRIELKPNEVRSIHYRLRAKSVGRHTLEVTARGSGIADAIRREITVEADGRRIETVHNGSLAQPAAFTFAVPANAIDGSVRAIVKLYPSSFSQLVEGLDGIFQRPYGCFEQASSTTYPNILALDYLSRSGKSVPAVEAKARQYIHLGYQRLLTFEVDGGGFDWYGDAPANVSLTAYGLMEFVDMARVHDVDPQLIERTRNWLMEQRKSDGSWPAPSRSFHGLDAVSGRRDLELITTAYVAWSVFGDKKTTNVSQPTLDYLLAHRPESIDSPYVLALVANALMAIDPAGNQASVYLDRLEALKQTSGEGGKKVSWKLGETTRTTFYGSGRSGDIETTALATLALLKANRSAGTVRGALGWLVEQRDGNGTWHTTQASVLALKALTAGTGTPLGGEQPRTIDIAVDGKVIQTVNIPADQAEVMQQLNLSRHFTQGEHRLTLTERTQTATGFQVQLVHHMPEPPSGEQRETEPLTIELAYNRTALPAGGTLAVTATVRNNMPVDAPMVIVDLPIPAGFRIERAGFDKLLSANTIGKYQVTARSAIVYLRNLPAGATLELKYNLQATMSVKVKARPAVAYEYYNPEKRGASKPVELTVAAGE